LNRRSFRPVVLVSAFAALCLAVFNGCDSGPAGITLDDLSGWMVVQPNPVVAGEECTRLSWIYNAHASDSAFVDSLRIDTVRWPGFEVMPGDTAGAVEEMNRVYPTAGTYVHTLTYYTTLGVLNCPPCTVTVQPAK
jgi:hypothetical protein